MNKEIKFPFLLTCCKYTNDSFWKNIFENLAYGQSPNGTYISNNFLRCSYKNKSFSYKIEDKNDKKLYEEIKNLFQIKLDIRSDCDKAFIIEKCLKEMKESISSWKNIKKKNIRDVIITEYVLKMKKKYNLSLEQSKKILSFVYLSMIFKTIKTSDIKYNDYEIQSVKGIKFDNQTFSYDNDIYNNFESELSPEIIIYKKQMSDYWTKYQQNH